VRNKCESRTVRAPLRTPAASNELSVGDARGSTVRALPKAPECYEQNSNQRYALHRRRDQRAASGMQSRMMPTHPFIESRRQEGL
jgi:hypothetical protein